MSNACRGAALALAALIAGCAWAGGQTRAAPEVPTANPDRNAGPGPDLGAFAAGVDAGVELVRYKDVLVEITGRAIGLWYNRDSAPTSDLVLERTLAVGVPF